MRIFKSCIIFVALLLGLPVFAVTLPSTSYQSSSYGSSYSSGVYDLTSTGVSLPKSSFSMLGDGGSGWGDYCTGKYPSSQQLQQCFDCCESLYEECEDGEASCEESRLSCVNSCGRSVPLGSGLCMLLMALCYGGARVATSNISKGK